MDAPKDPVLLTAWLERAPSHVAAAWVSSFKVEDRLFGSSFPENALKILKARNDRFLDLAIALHGDDGEILRELWATGGPAIRRAVLSNQNRDHRRLFQHDDVPCFLTSEAFQSFLAEADLEDVGAFVVNPTLAEDNLSAVFERKGVWAKLPDDRWHWIAVRALLNPNLHSEYEEEEYPTDGFGMYQHGRPISEALRVLFEVPAEEGWAWALHEGIQRFPYCDRSRKFLERALARWTLKSEAEAQEKATPSPGGSESLRMTLAFLASQHGIRGDWLEKHEDKWVRIGAAIAKPFYKPEEVRRCYEREGWAFLDAASKNPSLHRRSKPDVVDEVRSLLSRDEDAQAQGFDGDKTQWVRGSWSQEADRLHSLDPLSYFSWDEEVESPEDRSDDSVVRAFQELKHRLDNLVLTATTGSQRQRALEAVRSLSQTLSTVHEESQLREQRLLERMSHGPLHYELSRVRARITVALALIVILGLVVVFR